MKEVNTIDNLKNKLEEYLIEHNLTAIKFAMRAQINPISLYAWLNNSGYSLDNMSRAQIVNYLNNNK